MKDQRLWPGAQHASHPLGPCCRTHQAEVLDEGSPVVVTMPPRNRIPPHPLHAGLRGSASEPAAITSYIRELLCHRSRAALTLKSSFLIRPFRKSLTN